MGKQSQLRRAKKVFKAIAEGQGKPVGTFEIQDRIDRPWVWNSITRVTDTQMFTTMAPARRRIRKAMAGLERAGKIVIGKDGRAVTMAAFRGMKR